MASDVATGKLVLKRYLTPKELALGRSRIIGIPSDLKLERFSPIRTLAAITAYRCRSHRCWPDLNR